MKGEVVYLGRLINQEGVQLDLESVRVPLKWEVPRNKRELQSFLGCANYYREFIKDYAVIVALFRYQIQVEKTKGSRPLCDFAFCFCRNGYRSKIAYEILFVHFMTRDYGKWYRATSFRERHGPDDKSEDACF